MGGAIHKLPIRKLLLSLLVLGIAGSIGGIGAFSAFKATTTNSGNTITSGTVSVSDNDSGSAMFSLSGMKPSDPAAVRCITVTYGGSLDANLRLYGAATGSLAQYVNLTIEKGTQTGGSGLTCGTYTSQATLYSGTVNGFATANNNYANGLVAFPGAATKWVTNDTLVYRVTVSLQNNNAAQGLNSTAGFTWEARNQ